MAIHRSDKERAPATLTRILSLRAFSHINHNTTFPVLALSSAFGLVLQSSSLDLSTTPFHRPLGAVALFLADMSRYVVEALAPNDRDASTSLTLALA